ncbi:adenylate/guanylate cyclase domain-containing protein [Cupriavidus basilensis]|uniref:Adenylate/guanylate cyclase domain-containing protein n=1 Tax=Cupriavidus basilensis TaxID=68895 RepID=A0ABT6AS25_9BURK|nr:adenylate/guanylate cyclase domain-containing protein [Cupriavidus basilensis]MDF3835424.1 adenylate/guanylate cyclase domain-containing protein [Cupriavidus basilensis]
MDREPKPDVSDGDGAVLFADVSNSTRLYETAGNAAAFGAIGQCIAVMKSCSSALQGRVVKTIGDEVMVVFPSAGEAMQAALDMQQAVALLPPVSGVPLSIHIGFHHGPILRDGAGDVFGDTVNLAARLAKLASRGQIITSKDAVAHLSARLRQATRYLYPIQVRGKERPIELFEAIWQQNADMTVLAEANPRARRPALLTLRHRETQVRMDGASPPATIGRDAAMTIVVADRQASRFHAIVESRAGKYILIDRSANGTHITMDGDDEIILRRDEVALRGHGWITFGQPMSDAGERVEFSCT